MPSAAPSHQDPTRPFARTLLASALLGALFGLLYPAGQVAIEPAQLLAGLVAYPPDNGFWLYETRAWTVLHQLLAVPLALGVDERTLSLVLSGGIGALNFAAIAAAAQALGAPPLWSVFAPFVLWAMNPISWGYGYPILLVGHPHTYGTVGLAWVLLATSTIAAGRFGVGGALIGFAPALHASLGASMLALCGASVLLGGRALASERPAFARGAALGLALALASFALHRVLQPAAPSADLAAIDRLFPVFLEFWDAHRQPIDFSDWRAWPLGLALGISLAGLGGTDPARPGAPVLRRVVVGSAILGVLFATIRKSAPPDALPQLVLSAMPTRILNVPVIAFVPLVIAELTHAGTSIVARGAAIGLGASALLWQYAPWLQRFGVPAAGTLALVEAAHLQAGPFGRDADSVSAWRDFGAPAARGVALALALGVAWVLVQSVLSFPQRAAVTLADRSTDAALHAASQGAGLLAVAPGVERAQLLTRRPIVIDPQAIDMVTYVPASLPALARAIDDLYGIPFGAPALRDRHNAVVPVETVRDVWTERAPDAWAEVGRAFGVRDVLVPAEWELSLPLVARSPLFALYRLPPENSRSQ